MDICPRCNDLVRRFKETEEKLPFGKVLKRAFLYPLALEDKMKLVGFAIFLLFWAFMKTIMPLNPIFYANWAVGLFLWAVFLSYIIKSVKSVGNGQLSLPDWPDFSYFMDDLIIPSIKVSLTSVVLIGLPIFLGMALITHQLGLGIMDVFMGGSPFGNQAAIEQQLKTEAAKKTQEMQDIYNQIYGDQSRAQMQNMSPAERREYQKQRMDEMQKRMDEKFKEDDSSKTLLDSFTGMAGFKRAADRAPLIILYLIFFGILTLTGILIYPMGYYIAAGYESLKGAVNPLLLIQLIMRSPVDYFMLLVMWITIGIVSATTGAIFKALGLLNIFVLGLFFELSLNLYFGLATAYVTGMFAYQNRYKLGFYKEEENQLSEIKPAAPSSSKTPLEFDSPISAGKMPDNPHLQKPAGFQPYIEMNTPLDDDIVKGREFKKLGELDTALDHFNLALEVNPTHPIALRECFKIYLSKDDKPKAENAVNRLMNHYTGKDKKNEALILFGEVMGVLPMHTFSQRSQKKIAAWLKDIGDYKNAVVAYRNYAYRYNRDAWAPTSLLEAGILCRDKLGSKDLASKIFNIIINNFPKTEEAQRSKDFLKSL